MPGGGQTRVSANLYNDGKVCISLLGTSLAWNESQRWDPSSSSLAQVLLSIQTQILGVPDPYYSEGFAHQGLQGSRAGDKGSARYNNAIRKLSLCLPFPLPFTRKQASTQICLLLYVLALSFLILSFVLQF